MKQNLVNNYQETAFKWKKKLKTSAPPFQTPKTGLLKNTGKSTNYCEGYSSFQIDGNHLSVTNFKLDFNCTKPGAWLGLGLCPLEGILLLYNPVCCTQMVHHGCCDASLRRVCVGAFLALPHSCTSRWTGPSRILKKIPNKRSFVLWHIEEVWKSCAIEQIPSKTTVNGNSGTTTLNAAIHVAKLKLKSWK